VSVRAVARFIRLHAQLASVRRKLCTYDSSGDGCLREHDLENYVFEVIPELPDLAGLQENFYPFYVFTAVRKFFFFLDPNHTGRISVVDLVSSRVLAEWLQLVPSPYHVPAADAAALAASSLETASDGAARVDALAHALLAVPVPPSAPGSNWFSASNALRVYSQYLELDGDQNGMLAPHELARFRGGTLTDAIVARVFQECHTYSGEMDYKSFLDFVLAAEYRTSAQSLKYMFRLLDVNRTGALTLFELRFFFRDVAARMAASGHDPVDVANVCDEIFDMVHPAVPGRITLEDLRRCKVGHTVLHILADVSAFWSYDTRETLMQQQQTPDGGDGAGGLDGGDDSGAHP
jgi:serine/threonine-protein phosphatase 2A regulatory subunit B''